MLYIAAAIFVAWRTRKAFNKRMCLKVGHRWTDTKRGLKCRRCGYRHAKQSIIKPDRRGLN